MRILFIGDIVGKPGRRILTDKLSELKSENDIDVVIANAENSAGGNGITKNMAEELYRAGVDVITLGDHIWDQRCFEGEIDSIKNLCRPLNLAESNPGNKYVIFEKDGIKLGVFSLLGNTLMKIKASCPFEAISKVLPTLDCDIYFLDFHAETTSEKVSMAWHLDGKVQAIVGTHTHIPTSDARIFPQGTAYMTDAGMTGPWESCLGRNYENILKKFIDGRPRPFTMAEGDVRICACIIDIDTNTKKAKSIKPLVYPPFVDSVE